MEGRLLEPDVRSGLHPDELWRLVTEPDSLARWLGPDVELEATQGAPGRVVRR